MVVLTSAAEAALAMGLAGGGSIFKAAENFAAGGLLAVAVAVGATVAVGAAVAAGAGVAGAVAVAVAVCVEEAAEVEEGSVAAVVVGVVDVCGVLLDT